MNPQLKNDITDFAFEIVPPNTTAEEVRELIDEYVKAYSKVITPPSNEGSGYEMRAEVE